MPPNPVCPGQMLRTEMEGADMKLGDSFEDILRKLYGQAVVQYGDARTEELRESLEETCPSITT